MTATATADRRRRPLAAGARRGPGHRGRRARRWPSTRCSAASRRPSTSAPARRTACGSSSPTPPTSCARRSPPSAATPSCTAPAASRTREELADAMRRTEQEAVRMGSLVDDLLLLARLDQGRPLERQPVDLGRARPRRGRRRPRRPPRASARTPTPPTPVVVDGDDGRLRQVVANLVGNALVHTPPDAAVRGARARRRRGRRRARGQRRRGRAWTPRSPQQAFERFYRADPSRSRHQGGSGLGLADRRRITVAHGGRAELRTAPGEGTTVRIVLPAATPATSPSPG